MADPVDPKLVDDAVAVTERIAAIEHNDPHYNSANDPHVQEARKLFERYGENDPAALKAYVEELRKETPGVEALKDRVERLGKRATLPLTMAAQQAPSRALNQAIESAHSVIPGPNSNDINLLMGARDLIVHHLTSQQIATRDGHRLVSLTRGVADATVNAPVQLAYGMASVGNGWGHGKLWDWQTTNFNTGNVIAGTEYSLNLGGRLFGGRSHDFQHYLAQQRNDIAWDQQNFGEYYRNGEILSYVAGGTKLAADIPELASKLARAAPKVIEGSRSFLGNLGRAARSVSRDADHPPVRVDVPTAGTANPEPVMTSGLGSSVPSDSSVSGERIIVGFEHEPESLPDPHIQPPYGIPQGPRADLHVSWAERSGSALGDEGLAAPHTVAEPATNPAGTDAATPSETAEQATERRAEELHRLQVRKANAEVTEAEAKAKAAETGNVSRGTASGNAVAAATPPRSIPAKIGGKLVRGAKNFGLGLSKGALPPPSGFVIKRIGGLAGIGEHLSPLLSPRGFMQISGFAAGRLGIGLPVTVVGGALLADLGIHKYGPQYLPSNISPWFNQVGDRLRNSGISSAAEWDHRVTFGLSDPLYHAVSASNYSNLGHDYMGKIGLGFLVPSAEAAEPGDSTHKKPTGGPVPAAKTPSDPKPSPAASAADGLVAPGPAPKTQTPPANPTHGAPAKPGPATSPSATEGTLLKPGAAPGSPAMTGTPLEPGPAPAAPPSAADLPPSEKALGAHIGFTQDYTRNGASGIVLRSVPPGMPAQNSVPVAPGVHFTPATNGRPDWLTTELGNRDAGGMRIETHFINGKAFTDIKVRGNGGQIMGPAIASGGPEVLLALQDELKKNHGDVQATSSALSTKAGQAAFKKEAAAIKAHPDKAAAPATAKSEAGAPAQGAAQPHNPATPAPAPEAAGKKPEARKGSAAKPTRRTHAGHVLRGENSKAAAGRIVIEHPGPNSAAEKLNTYYDEHNPTGNAATNPDHFDPSRALTASQYKAAMAIRLKTSW